MIAIVKDTATEAQLGHFVNWIEGRGFKTNISRGEHETIVGIIGDTTLIDPFLLESMEIVEQVKRVTEPFKKAFVSAAGTSRSSQVRVLSRERGSSR